METLKQGQSFPKLSTSKVGGGTLDLPDDLAGRFGVVIFYRGRW